MDAREIASVSRAVTRVIKVSGCIKVLVNNADANLLGAVEETSLSEASALFETNVFGVLRMVQTALPHMRKVGAGCIVNVSSALGFLPRPTWAFIQQASTR